jgi:hypothetical protein
MVVKTGNPWFTVVVTLAAIAVGLFLLKSRLAPKSEPYMPGATIFDFTVESSSGKPVSLAQHKGKKAYLIVNVASKCGLTKKNYAELTEVYNKLRYVTTPLYRGKGLFIGSTCTQPTRPRDSRFPLQQLRRSRAGLE